jgi:hypothetical protein
MVPLITISTLLVAVSILGLDYWFRACNELGPFRAWQLLHHDRRP